MSFPLGQKLLYLGDLISEEHALRRHVPRDAPELCELRKRVKSAQNDAARFIKHVAPVEVKIAAGCITDKCDPRLLRLLSLVTRHQMYGLSLSLVDACDVCCDPQSEEYESFFALRHDIIESIAAGFYVSSRSPIYHSAAVLRLSRNLLFIIGGGVTSGLCRMQGVQRARWLKDD